MRIIKVNYQKPSNLFIAAIQNYCKSSLAEPKENNIEDLKDLEEKVWQYAKSQQGGFPRCSLNKLDVISHQNAVNQFYNLIYNENKSVIAIAARPDEFEAAFREYDIAKHPI